MSISGSQATSDSLTDIGILRNWVKGNYMYILYMYIVTCTYLHDCFVVHYIGLHQKCQHNNTGVIRNKHNFYVAA